MSDRDRLIELIKQATTEVTFRTSGRRLVTKIQRSRVDKAEAKDLANHLLANGVIVPPCKVGDIVYTIFEGDIEALKVTYTKTEESAEFVYRYYDARNKFLNMPFSDRSIGKTVFLTKEEAEKALAERSVDNA